MDDIQKVRHDLARVEEDRAFIMAHIDSLNQDDPGDKIVLEKCWQEIRMLDIKEQYLEDVLAMLHKSQL